MFSKMFSFFQINPDKAQLIMDDSFSLSVGKASERVKMEPHRPVSCWQEGPLHLCVAPVLVCKVSASTTEPLSCTIMIGIPTSD